MSEPKVGDRRIVRCPSTKEEIVAEYTGIGWLCLHNDDPEEDAFEVDEFRRLNKGETSRD